MWSNKDRVFGSKPTIWDKIKKNTRVYSGLKIYLCPLSHFYWFQEKIQLELFLIICRLRTLYFVRDDNDILPYYMFLPIYKHDKEYYYTINHMGSNILH